MGQWKALGKQAWAALKSSLKSLKEAVDGNTSAVSDLGTDLTNLSTLSAAEIAALKSGKAAANHTHTAAQVGAAAANHTHAIYSVGTTAPGDTKLLWIDTGAGVTKYYNGSAWVALPVAWG